MEKSESGFRIAIIGLGIIGGSMAYALRGFRGGEIIGCDINEETRRLALKNKAVHSVTADPAEAVQGADLIIICVYPDLIARIIEQCAPHFKPGAVITDVCGVKTEVARRIQEVLPSEVDYVGGHPMAGKEVEGFENASPELFWMTGFIVTPISSSQPESVALVKEMAHYIGATRIAENSPEEHDGIIAYTSDLMHISAAALCLDFHPKMNRAYTAGSFRDCTRIAQINPELWTEIFLQNKENTLIEIDRFLRSVQSLRTAIASENREELMALLSRVKENKKIMQKREVE